MAAGFVAVAVLSGLPNELAQIVRRHDFYAQPGWLPVMEFPWWVMFGSLVTFVVAVCFRTPAREAAEAPVRVGGVKPRENAREKLLNPPASRLYGCISAAGHPPAGRGAIAQLVRAPPCHGGGCGFEPRWLRNHSQIRFIFGTHYFALAFTGVGAGPPA